jgi:hypothetical protein
MTHHGPPKQGGPELQYRGCLGRTAPNYSAPASCTSPSSVSEVAATSSTSFTACKARIEHLVEEYEASWAEFDACAFDYEINRVTFSATPAASPCQPRAMRLALSTVDALRHAVEAQHFDWVEWRLSISHGAEHDLIIELLENLK